MADVHQCPDCELRFLNRTELDYHWVADHSRPAEVEREPTETGDDSRPDGGGRRP